MTGPAYLADAGAPEVVALGGGHGLSASLSALRRVTEHLTAVVTVADNGGSSGRLRREFPQVLPPGDLRQALAALCGDDEWGDTWARVMQHRFGGEGQMSGHVVGNMLLLALWDMTDTVSGLDWAARLVGAKGRVLPMASVPLDIVGEIGGLVPGDRGALVTVRGQAQVAGTAGWVAAVHLDPADPPACPEAVQAVMEADAVVLGPGSWFTSVMPHLMVPELAAALRETRARRVLTLNVAAQRGETDGFTPARHLRALRDHADWLRLDWVVVDEAYARAHQVEPGDLARTAATFGAEVVAAQVADPGGRPRHDVARLAEVYRNLIGPLGHH